MGGGVGGIGTSVAPLAQKRFASVEPVSFHAFFSTLQTAFRSFV